MPTLHSLFELLSGHLRLVGVSEGPCSSLEALVDQLQQQQNDWVENDLSDAQVKSVAPVLSEGPAVALQLGFEVGAQKDGDLGEEENEKASCLLKYEKKCSLLHHEFS